MFSRRVRSALITAAAAVGLTGCTTYGAGGLGGVSVGYGDPYYGGYGYDPYGSRYRGYGYGYGYNPYMGYGYPGGIGYGYPYYGGYPVYVGVPTNPNAGWYNGFFYPGTGTYVYDRKGNRYAWSDEQRSYWESRRTSTARVSSGASVSDGMRVQRHREVGTTRTTRVDRPTRTERQTMRTERRSDRLEARELRRSQRMTTRTQRRPN